MVFGNPGGYAPPAAAPAGAGNSGDSARGAAPVEPPSYIVGVDALGNIQHEVQPGDTLGDIALIYGYTWDDLPYMMQLNGLSDVRDLVVGSIFLVPPHAGTYTPTPDPNTPTPLPSATPIPPTITPFVVPTDTPPSAPSATVGAEVTPPAGEALAVANAPTPVPNAGAPPTTAAMQPRGGNSTWLAIALAVQVLVVIGAGIEFIRRARRR
jgi:hypothetical protein